MVATKRDPLTGLTDMQTKFVEEMFKTNGRVGEAASNAGYCVPEKGHVLMRNPKILEAIDKKRRDNYRGAAIVAAEFLSKALLDEDFPKSEKVKIALAIVDRAGDKQPEKIEISDNRTPEEINERLNQLLGIGSIDDQPADEEEQVH